MVLIHLLSCIYSNVLVSTSSYNNYLSLNFKNESGYHTYWNNPGNIGKETKVTFTLDSKPIDLELIEWPIPTIIKEGNYTSYALFGEYSLFFDISNLSGNLSVFASWGSCKDSCILGSITLEASLKNGKLLNPTENIDTSILKSRLNALPSNIDIDVKLFLEKITNNTYKLSYKTVSGILIPYNHEKIKISPTEDYFIINTTQKLPGSLKFLFLDRKNSGVITASLPFIESTGFASFLLVILMAFIGGLILNFMPCIFPVIALKAITVVNTRKFSNLIYALGIMFSFIILGLLAYYLNRTASIHWGFQFQSPSFLIVASLIFFLLALNLFDLYHIPIRISLSLKETYIYDFIAGIFTTIIASSCSAPFIGAAMTAAFTTTPLKSLLIFIFLGLGMSLPFILLFFFPNILKKLPKPGTWMVTFKQVMGLLFLVSFLWLYYLYFEINGYGNILHFSLILLFIWFNFYIKKIIFFIISLIISIIILLPSSNLTWNNWSLETWNNYKAENKSVFVAVTAKWCLTCMANKPLLSSKKFKHFITTNNIRLLEADLTTADQEITNWLISLGSYSIPTYVLLKENGEIILNKTGHFKNLYQFQ